MGNIVSTAIGQLPLWDNPTIDEIKAYHTELEQLKASVHQRETDEVAGATLELEASRHTEKPSKKGINEATKGAKALKLHAARERANLQKTKKGAEKAIKTAEAEGDIARQKIENAQRVLENAKASEARAEEDRQKAMNIRNNAEGRLSKQPTVPPTAEEVCEAMQRVQYKKELFHVAVTGNSGSGKSSLVNAFRGLGNRDPGAATTGFIETTSQMARYPDVNPKNPYVWYDIPGAGTFSCPASQYFNNQGLYLFDCIIVVIDTRVTETDLAILANANTYKIPAYIVRSKADQHINNALKDWTNNMGTVNKQLRQAVRLQFIEETKNSVRSNLQRSCLPDQRVYIVSNTTLLNIVRSEQSEDSEMIDEVELLKDLLCKAYRRRGRSD